MFFCCVTGNHKMRRVRAKAVVQPDSEEEEESEQEENEDDLTNVLGADNEKEGEEDDDTLQTDEQKMDSEEEEQEPKTITALQRRLQKAQDEIEKLEEEQLEKKHWSVSGEATAHQRPLNSLLELHVDLPMSHFASKKSIDTAIAGGYDELDGDDDDAAKPGEGEGTTKNEKNKIVDFCMDPMEKHTKSATFDDICVLRIHFLILFQKNIFLSVKVLVNPRREVWTSSRSSSRESRRVCSTTSSPKQKLPRPRKRTTQRVKPSSTSRKVLSALANCMLSSMKSKSSTQTSRKERRILRRKKKPRGKNIFW